ncbi:hypothetical protein [Pontiella agarivorans]|uniref:Aspartyl protease n=1 Tax=Pontiella agarivorans TaxID=3038953 RepID=A0ABU5MYX2_9BACT|nr:hypothetical protein [Pontiella agarivorans]MDZ8119397.1 hypothetical protein [Pontiella agarivorans]
MVPRPQTILAAALLLAGKLPASEEFVLPRMQRNVYLSHAKPAEQFGLKTVEGEKGPTYAGSAKIIPEQPATIAFETGPIPVIRVSGTTAFDPMNALLDTGSPVSWMEFGTAQKFDAVFLGSRRDPMVYTGNLNTGKVPGYAAAVPVMKMGYIDVQNTPLYVRMAMNSLGPLARGIAAPRIDAVFGYDLLKNFEYIHFDFQKREVCFSSTDIYVPDTDLLMSICSMVKVPEGGLAVEGSISGIPTPVILDVAGDFHFSRGEVKVHLTRQVSLGDVVWRKVPTLLLPPGEKRMPRAGRRMLERYTVTVCPKKGVVYFERLPE